MFDFGKFTGLVAGGLTRPRETWEAWLAEKPSWQQTAIQLTLPLLVAAVLIGSLLAALLGGYFVYGYGRGFFVGLILGVIMAAVSVALLSFVVAFLGGIFDGRNDFDGAFAGVSLAIIPGWVGMALSGIPFIGWLLSLAGFIAGLVFLYQVIPLAVGVPENRRVMHFVLTIVVVFAINVIIGAIFGAGQAARMGMGG